MRLLARPAAALALGLALGVPVWAVADDTPKSDPPAKKKVADKTPDANSSTNTAASTDSTAAPSPATPAPAPAPAQQTDKPATKAEPVYPVAPLLGDRATTFTLESGEMLGRHVVGFSAGASKISRAPGDVTDLDVDLDLAVGINDRISLFLGFTPYSHIHTGRPTELSLNPTLANCPLVPLNKTQSTIYHFIDCGAGTAGAAYVEDYPFANHNGGGVGKLAFGAKFNLLSQQRGSSPIAVALRTDFIVPTVTGLSDLLDNEVQNGEFNFQFMVAMSRKWGGTIETVLNLPVLITIDPRSGGQALLHQAKQFRPSFGFTAFPNKRFQIISEYNGVVFFGSATQNTTFGPRDPVDSVSGIRFYPWKSFAIDLGYRSTFGLNQVTDKNGFVIRAATTFVPTKKVPPPVTLECAVAVADPSAIEATTGGAVTITTRAAASDNGPISYTYDVSGGQIEGSGSQVRWNYSGLPAGTYTITPKAATGKLVATCPSTTVALTVAPPAPRLVCSATPSSVHAGEYVDVSATATDPKGNALPYPVTYQWRASGGTVEGSGANVKLNTTGLNEGDYSVTARAEGKGGAADCSAPVNVKNIQPAREIARCVFKKFSASVTNACKNPPLDGVPPRFQQFPGATLVIEATADPSETREDASKAMKTKGKAKVTPEQLAKDRAQNVKDDLVKRLGVPESAIETHSSVGAKGGAANGAMTITLVPQGAKYEPKNP